MSKAASFSRVSLYKKCPASYEWQYVLGNRREYSGAAAVRGTSVHDSIEEVFLVQDFSLFHSAVKPEVREWFLPIFNDVVSGTCEARPEMAFCLDKDWNILDDFDHEEGFVRGFIDNVFVYPDRLLLHEYKTGQEYDEHADQKALYAMIAMLMFPDYDSVVVEGMYIDKKKRVPTTYSRSHLSSMKFHWQREIGKLSIPLYPTRPGQHCRWCNKSSKEGGPCLQG